MVKLDTKWVQKPFEEQEVISLQKSLRIHPALCQILNIRGIKSFENARKFFRPTLKNLHNPFLMQDMEIAIQRINQAINYGEKILIYGDYDVDGTTAVSLVYSYFKEITDNLSYYVPNRYSEGYGISYQAIDWAKENEFSLIVCLDCGIKAVDKVGYANELGIDFVICDHHLPGDVLPPAVAVLDPKRKDCNYPFKELSGAGIGFKLVQAYNLFHRRDLKNIYCLLDLVAISIAADIVPIDGENRILAHYGLERLNNNPRPGIKQMLKLSDNTKKLTISDIVFVIGPRINAAGRMDDARKAIKLLISQVDEKAIDRAEVLQEHNQARRQIDADITQEALSMINDNIDQANKKSTVLYQPHWHKGVIGIVASRLMQHFYRPTVILTSNNGMATGSARSVNGFDIYEALKECEELIEQFGGHKYAAGLTIQTDNVPEFISKFEKVVSNNITDDQLIPEVRVDCEIKLKYLNEKFYKILKQMAPFGPANMRPVFRVNNVYDTGHSSIVGKDHLKLNIKQADSFVYKGIAYGLASKYSLVSSGEPFDIVFTLEENEFRNTNTLQFNVKDVKASEK